MESHSSSSNSSDSSDEESSPRPQPKFIHSWSSTCKKDNKIRPRPTGPIINSFKNDGSFLEMFKKMQEQNSQGSEETTKSSTNSEENKSSSNALSTSSNDNDTSSSSKINKFVGKRRTARVLPTGLVKKQRKGEQPEAEPEEEPKVERKNDPWSKYMDEVKKYKQQSCTDEESSRRPLVK